MVSNLQETVYKLSGAVHPVSMIRPIAPAGSSTGATSVRAGSVTSECRGQRSIYSYHFYSFEPFGITLSTKYTRAFTTDVTSPQNTTKPSRT
jgi:hypothetical protein